MLKLLAIAACLGLVMSFPVPGFDLDTKDPLAAIKGASSNEAFRISWPDWLPWFKIRTSGIQKSSGKNESVTTYSRIGGGWMGFELFGDFLFSDQNKTEENLGVGVGYGDLFKLYYNKELTGEADHAFYWNTGI